MNQERRIFENYESKAPRFKVKVSRKKIQEVGGLTKKQGHSEKCRGAILPKQMKEHCDTICALVKKSVISAKLLRN